MKMVMVLPQRIILSGWVETSHLSDWDGNEVIIMKMVMVLPQRIILSGWVEISHLSDWDGNEVIIMKMAMTLLLWNDPVKLGLDFKPSKLG